MEGKEGKVGKVGTFLFLLSFFKKILLSHLNIELIFTFLVLFLLLSHYFFQGKVENKVGHKAARVGKATRVRPGPRRTFVWAPL